MMPEVVYGIRNYLIYLEINVGFGNSGYGISSYGLGTSAVINQVPSIDQINVSRSPAISFTIASDIAPVDLSTLNVFVNSVELITGGVLSDMITGSIDSSDPFNVNVVINILAPFSILSIISVEVDVFDTNSDEILNNHIWNFTTDNTILNFNLAISKGYGRVLKVG